MGVVQDNAEFIAAGSIAEIPELSNHDWSLAQRIAFRFAFSYLVAYNLPFPPYYYIPYISNVGAWHHKFIYALVPWVGKHVFHLNITVFPNGSGDTTFNYILILCEVIFAIAATLIWTLLDRKRKQYRWLYDWLRVFVRYKLAVTMLSYGVGKLFKLQMSFPGLSTLLEPYGDSSPAGLLWNLMGYSTVYEVFAGAAETIGGLLLFFRRTTTLGTIVVSGVMLNVMMMNYCFDVPVKISSTHLFLMALFLLLPDLHSLVDILVLKRTTTPAKLRRPFTAKWMKVGGWAVKTIFIGYALFSTVKFNFGAGSQYGDYAPKSPLYGIYKVDEFTRNGQILPPLTTDANRWDKVVFQVPQFMSVKAMTNSRSSVGGNKIYDTDVDTVKSTVTLSNDDNKDKKYVFTYTRPDADHLILQEHWGTILS